MKTMRDNDSKQQLARPAKTSDHVAAPYRPANKTKPHQLRTPKNLLTLAAILWSLCIPSAYSQDYWHARDLLTKLSEAVEQQNELNLTALLQNLKGNPALDYLSELPRGITLDTELAFSECSVDYALIKTGSSSSIRDPKITVLFKEVPKGVWERFWVVENVLDDRGNPLPDQGFPLKSTSGNFTDLSDQVRDIANSDYVGLAPHGKLSAGFLAGRQFQTDLNSTKLVFNNIQLLDSTGSVIDYVYVRMGYRGFPQEWYITDFGPMSQLWLGRDRYIDFLIGIKDSGTRPAPSRFKPTLIQVQDTTLLQKVGDTTYFAASKTGFDSLYYQVAQEKNALSIGKSHHFLNLRHYPLTHKAPITLGSVAPHERGRWAVGLSLGLARSVATITRTYSAGNVNQVQAQYQGQTHFQTGLDLRYQYLPNISIVLNLSYQPWGLGYRNTTLLSNAAAGAGNWLAIQYRESISTMGVYLSGMYELRKPKPEGAEQPLNWVPYGELGIGCAFLLDARATLTQTIQPGAGTLDNAPRNTTFDYDVAPYRKLPIYIPGIALGLRLEASRSDCWLALRFRPMTANVVRYQDPKDRSLFPLSQGFYYMDDDWRLSQFALSLGYAYVIGKKQ